MNEVVPRLLELNAWSNSLDGWTLVTDARAMKAYPDLKEYVWQKNASMAPNGQYDKIGLHRLIKTGTALKGVIVVTGCPMWGRGEQRISNPTTDNWSKLKTTARQSTGQTTATTYTPSTTEPTSFPRL